MNAFQQAAIQAEKIPTASPPWQRLRHCYGCNGYVVLLPKRDKAIVPTCHHVTALMSKQAQANLRSNIEFFSTAGIDIAQRSFKLAESPIAKAGFPSPAADYVEDGIDLNDWMVKNPSATFFVRVSGDSMRDAGIFEGDVVSVDRSLSPGDRKIVVAVFEGAFYIKRLLRINGQLALCSENRQRQAEYPPMILADDPDHIVWGVVTGAIRKF